MSLDLFVHNYKCQVYSSHSGKVYDIVGFDFDRGFVILREPTRGIGCEIRMKPEQLELISPFFKNIVRANIS